MVNFACIGTFFSVDFGLGDALIRKVCTRAGIDIKVRQTDLDLQAPYLLVHVTFENLVATLRITLSEIENT